MEKEEMEVISILRDRLKEYRKLLEVACAIVSQEDISEETKNLFIKKCKENGVEIYEEKNNDDNS